MRKRAVAMAAIAMGLFAIGRGVYSAQAQGAPTLVALTFRGDFAVDSTGRIFGRIGSDYQLIGQAPSGDPVTLEQPAIGSSLVLGMANGDLYTGELHLNPLTVQFVYSTNVFGGVVASEHGSWSKLKRTFR